MITVIYGSPRRNGNTELLTDSFIQGLGNCSIERFYLSSLKLNPCISCGVCDKTGLCIKKDDISLIYESIDKSEGIVLASPIYFISVTAQMKAFIDRAQPYWARKYLLKHTPSGLAKKGFYISVGGVNTDRHFVNSREIVKCFMNTMYIDYSGELFFSGVDAKGAVKDVPGALEKARQAGAGFARLL